MPAFETREGAAPPDLFAPPPGVVAAAPAPLPAPPAPAGAAPATSAPGVAPVPAEGAAGATPAPVAGSAPIGAAPVAAPPKLTGPTELDGSLGKMTVVPDDYAGPMPQGAVRQAEQQRMETVYQHIASGESQIAFDTSKIMAGKDLLTDPVGYQKAMAEAAAFKAQYLGYLRDLVKTGPGLDLLSALDSSKHKTTIEKAEKYRNETQDADHTKATLLPGGQQNEGTDAAVKMNPALKSYAQPGQAEEPWMTERDRFGFYHELVHAYHDGRGDASPGQHLGVPATGAPRSLDELEFQAMGMGPYRDLPISDNAIRAALGKAERLTYGAYKY